jgi:choline dehydrogenase-like flavoprotein
VSAPLEADVVIIGSGVAGSLIAWRLAEAKLKVLILEAGPRIDRVEAFKTYLADEEPFRRRCRLADQL